jgi:hypothetical protein
MAHVEQCWEDSDAGVLNGSSFCLDQPKDFSGLWEVEEKDGEREVAELSETAISSALDGDLESARKEDRFFSSIMTLSNRKRRNREAAIASRRRKKAMVEDLKGSSETLNRENKDLRYENTLLSCERRGFSR